MSYGLAIRDAGGSVVFALNAKSALLYTIFDIAGGYAASYNVSYTDLVGRTVRWVLVPQTGTILNDFLDQQECALISVAYGSGYPTLTITPMARATTVYMFLAT